MSLYSDYVYPRLVDRFGDPPLSRKIRRQIIPLARGTVLEIGVGSGANFPHYDQAGVSKLYALEPNPAMIRLAERRRGRTGLNVEFLDLAAEEIPLAASTIDAVVSTFTLCTIPRVIEAIRGLDRVLRPDGRLIFLELGLSPDPKIRRWQGRLEPLHRWLFQVYLTRDIPSLLRQGGFELEQLDKGYLTSFLKASTHCWWGTAAHNYN